MLKYILSRVGGIVGALFMSISIPGHYGIFVESSPLLDTVILFPIGITLLCVSYYYTFVNKEWQNKLN
jgi:hypothetical protein